MAKTVLVVHTDPVLLTQIAEMLRTQLYEVLTATDGEEGWSIFNQHQVEGVISGVRMPNLSGVLLLQRIKNKATEVKVILIANASPSESEQEALASGATAFLYLPIQDASVISRLLES